MQTISTLINNIEAALLNWPLILITVTSVIGGASIIVSALAPLTKNTTDDKVSSVLGKIHRLFSRIALNPKP